MLASWKSQSHGEERHECRGYDGDDLHDEGCFLDFCCERIVRDELDLRSVLKRETGESEAELTGCQGRSVERVVMVGWGGVCVRGDLRRKKSERKTEVVQALYLGPCSKGRCSFTGDSVRLHVKLR